MKGVRVGDRGSGVPSLDPHMPGPCPGPACVLTGHAVCTVKSTMGKLAMLPEEDPTRSSYLCQGSREGFLGEVASELVLIRKQGGALQVERTACACVWRHEI